MEEEEAIPIYFLDFWETENSLRLGRDRGLAGMGWQDLILLSWRERERERGRKWPELRHSQSQERSSQLWLRPGRKWGIDLLSCLLPGRLGSGSEPAITQCLHHLPTSTPSSWGTLSGGTEGGTGSQFILPGPKVKLTHQAVRGGGRHQGFIVSQIQFTGVKVGSLIQSLWERILSGRLCIDNQQFLFNETILQFMYKQSKKERRAMSTHQQLWRRISRLCCFNLFESRKTRGRRLGEGEGDSKTGGYDMIRYGSYKHQTFIK